MEHRSLSGLVVVCIWAFAHGSIVAAPSTKSYAIGDVTLHYASDFRLLTSPQSLPASYIPVCDQPFDACLVYVGKQVTHPNFSGAAIRVHVSQGATRDSCVPAGQREGEGSIALHDRRTYVARVVRDYDAGMSGLSHGAGGELYRLLMQGRCYEIETRWTYLAPVRVPRDFSGDDARHVAAILRQVLETAMVKGQRVQW